MLGGGVVTCPMLVESGAYVLGALSPAQRQSYEQHLSTCAECRAEVGDLAVLPGLLGRLDAASVRVDDDEVTVPPAVLTKVVGRVRRRRRNQRLVAIGGALAAACLALVIGLTVPTHSTPSPSRAVASASAAPVMHAMKPVGNTKFVSASLGITPFSGGTRFNGTCTYAWSRINYAGPVNFQLYVYPKKGTPVAVSSWSAMPGDTVPFTGMTWWPKTDLSKVEVVGPSGPLLWANVT
jgi:putative zinc finger protein